MYSRQLKISKSQSFFLFGARGTGKTTFLREQFTTESSHFIDLLSDSLFAELQAYPDRLLDRVAGANKEWIVIDEVQKVPQLLDVVHQLIENRGQKFVLTGSSARKLKRGSANLLAGRAFVFRLYPFTHLELSTDFDLLEALQFGTLPRLRSLTEERDKRLFLAAYGQTYLKEEIISEQIVRNLPPYRRFLEVAAAQDTEVVSYTNIARDIHSDAKTVSNYFDILEDTLLGFRLLPYHNSVRKRQKKAPKFYWFDTGVVRELRGTVDVELKAASFEYGSLFESFIVNEIRRHCEYSERRYDLFYLRVDESLEIDLIIERPGLPTFLVEIKSTDRVHELHVQNLRHFAPDFPNARLLVISNDRTRRKIEGVLCLHWREAFQEMGFS